MYSFDDYIQIFLFLLGSIFGIWGLSNYPKFKEKYIAYCDKHNPYNINYNKGRYMDFVLISTLIMCVLMGFVTLFFTILDIFFIKGATL